MIFLKRILGHALFRKSAQFTSLFFVLYAATQGPWRNFKVAHNSRRLVGLMEGEFTGLVYGINDDFLNLFGKSKDVSLQWVGSHAASSVFGLPVADPSLAIGHSLTTLAQGGSLFGGMLLGAIIPLVVALILGKVFCSHLCPARLFFEFGQGVRAGLERLGVELPRWQPRMRLGAFVFLGCVVGSLLGGGSIWLFFLPHAALGVATHLLIGASMTSVLWTYLIALWFFDVLFAPGTFCHSFCPTGFLLENAGRFSPLHLINPSLRSKPAESGAPPKVTPCPASCHQCEIACPYSLSPKTDDVSSACDHCGKCVQVCPQEKLEHVFERPLVMSKARRSLPILGLFLVALFSPTTQAHHNKGLPHYGYFENYPQVPTSEYVYIQNGWEIGATVFNFQGLERENADTPNDVKIFLYVYDLKGDKGYEGPIDFELHHDGRIITKWHRDKVDEENIYSTRETLPESGDYAIRAQIPGQEKALLLSFDVDMGDGISIWLLLGLGVPVFVLFGLALYGKKKGKKKGKIKRKKRKAVPGATSLLLLFGLSLGLNLGWSPSVVAGESSAASQPAKTNGKSEAKMGEMSCGSNAKTGEMACGAAMKHSKKTSAAAQPAPTSSKKGPKKGEMSCGVDETSSKKGAKKGEMSCGGAKNTSKKAPATAVEKSPATPTTVLSPAQKSELSCGAVPPSSAKKEAAKVRTNAIASTTTESAKAPEKKAEMACGVDPKTGEMACGGAMKNTAAAAAAATATATTQQPNEVPAEDRDPQGAASVTTSTAAKTGEMLCGTPERMAAMKAAGQGCGSGMPVNKQGEMACIGAMKHVKTEDGGIVMIMSGMPMWIFVLGIVLVLVLSFVAVELFPVKDEEDELGVAAANRRALKSRFNLLKDKRVYFFVKNRLFSTIPHVVTVSALVFLVYAGLYGSRVANITPVAVWTIWWAALIFFVALFGPIYCAICPWDALANLFTRLRFKKRNTSPLSFGLMFPSWLRNLYPAIAMFTLLTWLELGNGVTTSPKGTAYMALGMTAFAIITALLFGEPDEADEEEHSSEGGGCAIGCPSKTGKPKGKVFCRYLCPVGRISGIYANLSTVEVRAKKPGACKTCVTEDCLNGNENGYPCPTGISLKVIQDSTYCTQCMECVRSCPRQNVAINLRPFGSELHRVATQPVVAQPVAEPAKTPRLDEAWLALSLLSLTLFHGLSMTPAWESFEPGGKSLLKFFHTNLPGSNTLHFTLGMFIVCAAPMFLYWLSCKAAVLLAKNGPSARELFARYSWSLLPVALFYHLAHNLMHLIAEGSSIIPLLSDPLGRGTDYFGTAGKHYGALLSEGTIWTMQVSLILIGHIIGIVVAHRIGHRLYTTKGEATRSLFPMLLMMILLSVGGLSLMAMDMNMRVGRM
ncbi:MAG: 4Fe-4S binding protein [Deltaproteobacteria bacterium]|nr:4Fe-4S binding protein [Deltaproteobacteria bacterium]